MELEEAIKRALETKQRGMCVIPVEILKSVLQELDNSISKEKVRKAIKVKEKLRKHYWKENTIKLHFIDTNISKIKIEELETNNKHMQLDGEIKALQRLLEE